MHFFRALHDQICYDVTRDTTQSSPIILLLPGCRAPRPRPPAGRRETTTTTHDDDNRLARSADARTNTHALHRLLPIVASPRRSEARSGSSGPRGAGDGARQAGRATDGDELDATRDGREKASEERRGPARDRPGGGRGGATEDPRGRGTRGEDGGRRARDFETANREMRYLVLTFHFPRALGRFQKFKSDFETLGQKLSFNMLRNSETAFLLFSLDITWRGC